MREPRLEVNRSRPESRKCRGELEFAVEAITEERKRTVPQARTLYAQDLMSLLLQFYRNGTYSLETDLIRLRESLARLFGVGGFQLLSLQSRLKLALAFVLLSGRHERNA